MRVRTFSLPTPQEGKGCYFFERPSASAGSADVSVLMFYLALKSVKNVEFDSSWADSHMQEDIHARRTYADD